MSKRNIQDDVMFGILRAVLVLAVIVFCIFIVYRLYMADAVLYPIALAVSPFT